MSCPLACRSAFLAAALMASLIPAGQATAADDSGGTGSTGFCLFELPPSGERRQWVNLAHIQYVELRPDELRLFYGGGNFGSGHESRIPVRNREEGALLVKRIQDAARACR